MEGGRIRQAATPAAVYDHPADVFVANFVGSPGMNFIQGAVAQANGASLFVSEAGNLPIEVRRPLRSGRATLGIRCEHIHEDPHGAIAGRVVTEEYLGSACHVHVETDCGRLIMRGATRSPRGRGSELRLRFDHEQISVFDDASKERL
jgi:multiple sugar transport system ATP-binding protein